ncbi:hypothetical protein A3A84_02870 [Candidatus Collierbacteria bacterium RIFCSPLOWO2_01_FULL_50_23]|uniref:Uncharacterized protein n=2 Tax=Candidatus Collieribacteriota TaxID=1752725 RepID=A0A1F5EWD6_9BACT|nr:MAG: hypothetical protein A2703_01135 [Candidatus Collierbacteria bacterium RIFCSPHIGHO2_01_FULL_50_25]OGD71718.1 MAG: hypothetical protein A3D09_04030 [Candidatus Collierbacteria bacterium RIFCSPHIGHO2_02_FULL_49_10]OGD75009.1 MAG: hypothetical protein A3A84_02870 [Candidatus Collierbacteria bacterium RIFCSPLOWO2_01_FULL_50_23]
MTERPKAVRVREHHLLDVLAQVQAGQPDAIPAYVPRGIRDANEFLVLSILAGAEVIPVHNRPDRICLGCPDFKYCTLEDP